MIEHATGLKMVAVGGEFTYAHRVKGDIAVILQWHDEEPVMVLQRSYSAGRPEATSYLIRLDEVWRYANPDGTPTKNLIRDGMECAISLGFGLDKAAGIRCIDAIMENVADLLKMPPIPPEKVKADAPVSTGDVMKVMLDGNTIIEQEV